MSDPTLAMSEIDRLGEAFVERFVDRLRSRLAEVTDSEGIALANTAHIATVRDMVLGTVDCIFALTVALANAGLINRQNVVAELDQVLDQQRQRDTDRHPATAAVTGQLRQLLATPVFDGKPN